MNQLENLRIVEHRTTIREGLRLRATAIYKGQRVSVQTHPLLESRLDLYDWSKFNSYLSSINLSSEELQKLKDLLQ